MRIILCLCYVLWYLITEINAGKYQGLIFNRKNLSIIIPPKNEITECSFWTTACPAKNNQERKFNNKFSFYNKALFVQSTHNNGDRCEDLPPICDEPFELSMGLSHVKGFFEFGFEIFYDKFLFGDITPTRHDDYFPMKNIVKITKKGYGATLTIFSLKMGTTANKKLKLDKKKMEFLWIPAFKVEYYYSTNLRHAEYDIRGNNLNPLLPCQDFSLGDGFMDTGVVDLLYSDNKQKETFEGVVLPSSTDEEGACTAEKLCLTKWSLIPTDQFQVDSSSSVHCSNMTTIPIWTSTIEGIMKKVDQYIYTLRRVSGYPLRIFAGVREILSLRREMPNSERKEIILAEKGKKQEILVPKIIFKLVKFGDWTTDCGNCRYGILIIIHNGPYFNEEDRICKDESETLGWDEIRYEKWFDGAIPSRFIYVCSITRSILMKLDLQDIICEGCREISLKQFPYFDKEMKLLLKTSIKEKISQELEHLSNPGVLSQIPDEPVERPSIYNPLDPIDDTNPSFL